MQEDRDLPKWDYVEFMERITRGGEYGDAGVEEDGEEGGRGRGREVVNGNAAYKNGH